MASQKGHFIFRRAHPLPFAEYGAEIKLLKSNGIRHILYHHIRV